MRTSLFQKSPSVFVTQQIHI